MATVKSLSEQIAQFQALMLASQEKISKEIGEVKQELKNIKEEIRGVKELAIEAKGMAKDNKEQIIQLKKQTAELSDRSRRANMIIHGISEDVGQKKLEQCLVEWISEQGIELKEDQIERAHRLQTKRRGGEPRPVIVKFAGEKKQHQIYSTLKKIKGLNYKGKKTYVQQDFCQDTLNQKRLMKPYAQRLYDNKIQFSWAYPASIIIFQEGKRLSARNPQEAVKLLEKMGLETRNLEEQIEMEETAITDDEEAGPSTHQEKRQRTSS
ncbi:PREDICTED: uncharacterized protein PF11_0207-like [Gekko japonicus]|uniref:Uncharacterized protein PF11_0207-like n=1 Tax=Gekko japonicus TaxID=146911 RepID=A0ABM1KTY1_GEKJA|nr:PREDICTED: uncharacterized protein PF11_0207-like [Gekko japonicus]XP_015261823.1 PREDICTED: uncharacterized protein PF11_0207-like [Gekko japonicus]XP_015277168.1 PREDICTED: uncharacterized protein PF11_0207-like [Gekko japonicus]XP_015277169.1 PREDICTED: uncharacterized protein PF11_0207-like [Gekko japonicus]XP_015284507.1 PREDICTED: uncharacterized protein PF11_0207-like [Gekko japonicus]XP_015284514.1 PREDICTED: uncharacterized protein PF11_0207-like [Gekko japonicus]XP_015284680.1 PR